MLEILMIMASHEGCYYGSRMRPLERKFYLMLLLKQVGYRGEYE
jgi:hypothetical protein